MQDANAETEVGRQRHPAQSEMGSERYRLRPFVPMETGSAFLEGMREE